MDKSTQRIADSADSTLRDFIQSLEVETSFHRMAKKGGLCPNGTSGSCCRLCANGPCNITEKTPRGVCGATADVIVSRQLLRSIAAGAACYLHLLKQSLRRLNEAAVAAENFPGTVVLDELCEKLGIREYSRRRKALTLAETVFGELEARGQMRLPEQMASPERFKLWKELGILPAGAHEEILSAMVKTSCNLNSDPMDMLSHCLRLGIVTGVLGLTLTGKINDILLGEPALHMACGGFRIIEPDNINILVMGHQGSLHNDLVKYLESKSGQLASKAGVKAIRLIGSTCVGQDLQSRYNGCVFAGQAGNNFTTEAILATGAIDCVISEFNCSLPGIEPICEQMQIKMLCSDAVAKKKGGLIAQASYPENIVAYALDSYRKRKGLIERKALPGHGCPGSLAGLGQRSLKRFFGDTWKPLIDLIACGAIRGIAGVVGCSTLVPGHDVSTAALATELIKRDILVLTAGCASGGLQNLGMMSPEASALAGQGLRMVCERLGIPPVLDFGPCLGIGRLEEIASALAAELNVTVSQLPLVLSAPQWLEEQALADATYALTLGLPLHVCNPPAITASALVTGVLTKDVEKLTGGRMIVESDPKAAADVLENIIIEKRKGIGVS